MNFVFRASNVHHISSGISRRLSSQSCAKSLGRTLYGGSGHRCKASILHEAPKRLHNQKSAIPSFSQSSKNINASRKIECIESRSSFGLTLEVNSLIHHLHKAEVSMLSLSSGEQSDEGRIKRFF